MTAPLLLVPLDRALGPGLGRARILTRVPQGAALAQEVPALVEPDLHVVQLLPLVVGEATTEVGGVELVLLRGQPVDAVQQVLVLHHETSQ